MVFIKNDQSINFGIIKETILVSENEGWILVRQCPQGNSWHPATDQLRGDDVYG